MLNTYNKQTWFTPLPTPSPASELPVLIDLPGQSARGAAAAEAPWPGRGAEHARPSRTRRATALSWAVDFGCRAFLQAYLLPWASYLTCVPGAQPKSKVVVILLSNCVSPGFSKCPSGQGLFLTRACSSHDPNGKPNVSVALLYRTGQHAPTQRSAHSPLLV